MSAEQDFINKILPAVVEECRRRGYPFVSVPIGQMCLESNYGRSELAISAKNIAGLKHRPERMPRDIGPYYKLGSEQNADGTYAESVMAFAAFNSWDDCVVSYFDFLSISRYENLRTCKTSWQDWLNLIREDGYATSLEYVNNVSKVIEKFRLYEYDLNQVSVSTSFTNSPLVQVVNISPNRTAPRNHVIDRITIHCVVGQVTAQRLGEIFAPTSRSASSNYGIGKDGEVGMYCEEKDRSWCSSSADNDHRAITIECASDTFEPYYINDKVYATLLNLCTDICKRNGKTRLTWNPSKEATLETEPQAGEMRLTVHRWFAAKSCPGTYIYERLGEIANEVTARLQTPDVVIPPKTKEIRYIAQVGEYRVKDNARNKALWVNNLGIQNLNCIVTEKEIEV